MDYETVVIWSRIAGTLLFFGLFIAFVVWSYRPGSKPYYDRAAHIPLSDGVEGGEK